MKQILLFAGTTEGRRLSWFLSGFPVHVYVSVATEYGRAAADTYDNTEIISGRMEAGEILSFILKKHIDWVIDATHPFARLATENIRLACQSAGVEYIRCLREEDAAGGDVQVDNAAEAVEYLQGTKGNILIATGTRELSCYTALKDYKERCYVRVLSVEESLRDCFALGFEGRHLLAMQGPFSKEMNVAILRHVNAAFFVTKESGREGGFREKLEAARETGAKLVVLRRPRESGLYIKEILSLLAQILGTEAAE